MRDVVEVCCTVISRNYGIGTVEEHEVSQACLGTSRRPNWRILNTLGLEKNFSKILNCKILIY
jgi:hypothetical protein